MTPSRASCDTVPSTPRLNSQFRRHLLGSPSRRTSSSCISLGSAATTAPGSCTRQGRTPPSLTSRSTSRIGCTARRSISGWASPPDGQVQHLDPPGLPRSRPQPAPRGRRDVKLCIPFCGGTPSSLGVTVHKIEVDTETRKSSLAMGLFKSPCLSRLPRHGVGGSMRSGHGRFGVLQT